MYVGTEKYIISDALAGAHIEILRKPQLNVIRLMQRVDRIDPIARSG